MSPSFTPRKLVCIFAHPDDEAFGPGGAIAHYAKTCEVHIICVTDGGAGRASDPILADNLAKVRMQEMQSSANILRVKSVTFLEYADGTLANNNYHEVAKRVQSELDKLEPDTLLTFDLNGVSGHLDHVAVAMIASYLWERLGYVHHILYFCEHREMTNLIQGKYFTYFPDGITAKRADLALDVSAVYDIKLRAMHAHASQKEDCDMLLAMKGDYLKTELFLLKSKL